MNIEALERLVRKYYGYVADMEGSSIEILDLLFVRDKIQKFLSESGPDKEIPGLLYEQIYELDRLLWEERDNFLIVIGEKELHHARRQQAAARSHWWWYLDELKTTPQPIQEQRNYLAQTFISV